MNKKEIKEKLSGSVDSVTFHKDGTISVKRGYFYRHGMTTEAVVKRVLLAFPYAEILSSTDRWAPWPRDSYFFVRFRLPEFDAAVRHQRMKDSMQEVEQSRIAAEMDLELAYADADSVWLENRNADL